MPHQFTRTALLALFLATLGSAQSFQDVAQAGSVAPYYNMIQIARAVGLAVPATLGACTSPVTPGANPPIIMPPGSGPTVTPAAPICPYFGPDTLITRAEASYWIVRSVMDEAQISRFLCATGGDPSGLSACNGGIPASTFADVGPAGALIANPFVSNPGAGVPGVSNAQFVRYIEVMDRRGYTKGCSGVSDPVRRFCPNDLLTRAQVAVFVIRAKMDNVFPTTLSGAPSSAPYGDNFGVTSTPYFTDVTPSDPVWGGYYIFVQKMRELQITSGTGPTTFSPGNNISRKEMATFAVKAFFI